MSKSILKYNGLNGAVVSREDLQHIVFLAQKEEQNHIAEKLQLVLSSNEDLEFDIELRDKAFEIAPASMLNGLHYEETEEEDTGLNKAVSPSDIYQMISNRMVSMIEEASGKDYIKKWKRTEDQYLIPFNFDTKKRYRGVNSLLLTEFGSLSNPYFLTFKQIEKHKGVLKKGSQGYPVIYFTKLYKVEDKAKGIDFGSYDRNKVYDFAKENSINPSLVYYLPILKYYNVFNGQDIENIDFDLKNFTIGYLAPEIIIDKNKPIERIASADAIINNYPAPAPKYIEKGNDAFFSPNKDAVQMPPIQAFETVQDFYRTKLHEYSHSTGIFKRLNRDFSGKFGSKPYAFEELVAEWGATFLSAEAGIIWHNNKNHAEYLKNWNNALTYIKEDTKFVMRACTKAQELTDFVLQFDEEGNPKYLKDLKQEIAKPNDQEKTKKTVKKATKITKKPLKLKVSNDQEKTKEFAKKQIAAKKEIKKPIPQPRKRKQKVDKNGQIALFGAKEKSIETKLNGVPVIEEMEQKPVEKSIATNKLMQMEFDSLPINDEWSELMQNPASNLKIAIWGKPKNGKTSGSLQMAEYFTNFGNVLYNFADQGFNKSTQDLWIDSGLANNNKAFPDDSETTEALEKEIATGKYKFVFIDMISDYIRKEKLRPEEFKERFIKRYPNVSFILIFEVTKGGDFKGDQGWTHLVDAIMTVEDFLIENRGRYGMGERVIWEEGFKKFNPKRYEEYLANKQINSPSEIEEQPGEIETETETVEFSFTVN